MNKPKDVDEYIGRFPSGVQQKLKEMRNAIKKAAPHTKEIISYSMPAYRQHSNLVYFAGWDKHVGFYPGAEAIAHFKDELAIYKGAKGSVQFPLDEPLPVAIINKIVAYRIQEDEARALAKEMKKRSDK